MNDAISELKIRARMLHKRVQSGDTAALERVRRGQQLTPDTVQHKHCLAAVARENGFRSWQHATRVVRGDVGEQDFGKLLVPGHCGGFLNEWFADYDQALAAKQANNRFLLAYQRHFVVVTADFIRALGLDPNDPDWRRINRNWVQPGDVRARERLYGRLLGQRANGAPANTQPDC